MSGADRPGAGGFRVTVAGSPPLAYEIDAGPVDVAGAHGPVRRLPATPGDPPGSNRLEVVVDGWRFEVTVEAAARAALRDRARRSAGETAHERHVLRAPLPGRIVRVWVVAGDEVQAGQRICSLEAMKMENEVRAVHAGRVERIGVEPGSHVELGDELAVIA